MVTVRGRDSSIPPIKVDVYCINCLELFVGNLYKNDSTSTGFDLACRGLTKHIKQPSNPDCLKLYDMNYRINGSLRDYMPSLSDKHRFLVEPKPVSRQSYSPFDLGVIPKSPNASSTDPHQTQCTVSNSRSQALLNAQTIFYPYQQPMSKSVTDSAHSPPADEPVRKSNSDIDTDQPVCDLATAVDDTHELNEEVAYDFGTQSDNESSPTFQHNSTKDSPPIELNQITASMQSNKLLLAETKLLKIITDKKMPLNAFQSIFEWAIESQQSVGFDFANYYHARCRKTILKDIRRCLPPCVVNEGFENDVVEWYPDRKPIQVTVKPFLKALKNLLT